jgi:hypothetical protein
MKNILPLLLLLIAIPSQAEIVSRNLIGTAADIHITKNYQEESDAGEVLVKLCASCSSYKLVLTSKTELSKDDTEFTLDMLKTYLDEKRNAPMHLQFHKNTNHIISIELKHNNKEYPQ